MIQNQNYQKTPFLSKCEAKRKGANSPPLPCENYCETMASAKKLFHNVLTKKLRLMKRGLTSFFPISPHYHIGPQSHLFPKIRFTPYKTCNTKTLSQNCDSDTKKEGMVVSHLFCSLYIKITNL